MERLLLNEEVITNLGFGEYWGDSGNSGTRHLSRPDKPGYCFMRIHDFEEFLAGAYAGGYYHAETTPQHYTTDDMGTTLIYLDELLEYSKQFAGAYEHLVEKCKQHNYPFS